MVLWSSGLAAVSSSETVVSSSSFKLRSVTVVNGVCVVTRSPTSLSSSSSKCGMAIGESSVGDRRLSSPPCQVARRRCWRARLRAGPIRNPERRTVTPPLEDDSDRCCRGPFCPRHIKHIVFSPRRSQGQLQYNVVGRPADGTIIPVCVDEIPAPASLRSLSRFSNGSVYESERQEDELLRLRRVESLKGKPSF